MHSYNHLYETFISDENIILSIHTSSKGKRTRNDVAIYQSCSRETIEAVRTYAEHFHNAEHRPVKIYDGITRKRRGIIVPTYREQIVHHMLVNAMRPIILRSMYEHSYAAVPGRGTHARRGAKHKQAKETIEKWLRDDRRNTKYCLKMDIQKFFDSIPVERLEELAARKIHDDRFNRVLFEVLEIKKRGIPLGFYTSQWLSNWFLESLDHYIKEKLRAKYYIRYMDDMVIFGSNKRQLHKMQQSISTYLNTELGLSMKANWQVFRMDYIYCGEHKGRYLDFLGFKFYRDRTTLRKTIMLRASRCARRMSKKEKVTLHDISQLLSYMGYIDCTDTYDMYLHWIKPYIDVQRCKRRKSRHDRRKHECNGTKLKAQKDLRSQTRNPRSFTAMSAETSAKKNARAWTEKKQRHTSTKSAACRERTGTCSAQSNRTRQTLTT